MMEDLTLLGAFAPAFVGVPGGKINKNTLPAIPELVLRCFPVLLKIIPHEIIFPFLKLVRENRSLHAMKRELQLLSIPGLLCMIEQPLCTIPGLADVADLLRTGIA